MPRLQVIPLKQSKLRATLRSAAKRPGFRRMRLASSPKDIPVFLAGIKHCGMARDFDQGATTSMPILGTTGTGRRAPHPGQALPDPVMVTDLVDWILRYDVASDRIAGMLNVNKCSKPCRRPWERR